MHVNIQKLNQIHTLSTFPITALPTYYTVKCKIVNIEPIDMKSLVLRVNTRIYYYKKKTQTLYQYICMTTLCINVCHQPPSH